MNVPELNPLTRPLCDSSNIIKKLASTWHGFYSKWVKTVHPKDPIQDSAVWGEGSVGAKSVRREEGEERIV